MSNKDNGTVENKIKIVDTLKNNKVVFEPIDNNKVKMYVCGITPYDCPHIGHGRVYVTFDVFYRLLKYLGYDIKYCRNFTDIDDKLLQKSEKEFGTESRFVDIANRYIDIFNKNMAQLNCLTPDYEPRVTECIDEIIDFVAGLISSGKAYVVDGDVYFSIKTFPEYTKLSKKNLDDLRAGARVEVDQRKRDPLDFALWKSEPEGTFWKSPWGYGRPGWHIECSAMAKKFLGETIDVHAGGMDLIFPHHENEIAQSEGLSGKVFSKYWMHNAFVNINKEKMSKSLNNFFTLEDVFKEFDPMVFRYYYLNHSYNSPLDFSFEDIKSTQKSYQKLCKFFSAVPFVEFKKEYVFENEIGSKMLKFLMDDLNTPGMFGVVFENLKDLETDSKSSEIVKFLLINVLGLTLEPLKETEFVITQEIENLIKDRDSARLAKDFKRADEIRDKLKELGYNVQDLKIK